MNCVTDLRVLTRGAFAVGRSPLARQMIWLSGPFAVQQAIRLATSVVLARLLAPELFGVMLLINTLRTGTELLSDIGVSQSVVRSTRAGNRGFLDTAWTIQVLRGTALTLVALLAAWPIAKAYDDPLLLPIIGLTGSTFFLAAISSPDTLVWQREMRVKRRAAYEVACTLAASVGTIALAAWWCNLWALVWGLVVGQTFSTMLTYAMSRPRPLRLQIHKIYLSEILGFGKWIFLSTTIYFAAISADKLYFSAVLPLGLVGVYSVAKTFSDMLGVFAQRIGSLLVFPKVAELRQRHGGVAEGFRRKRRLALCGIAATMAVSLAVSDQLIVLFYDDRYRSAAFMLPVLLTGVWFSVLATFAEATLFGLDRPQASAAGNAVKFAILITGLPLLVPTYGLFAGMIVLLGAEIGRWLTLAGALRRYRLSAIPEEIVLTLAVGTGAAMLKCALGMVGAAPGLATWWASGTLIHG